MINILAGALIFCATGFLLWKFLPRGGKKHRTTENFGTIVGITITCGFAIGFAMVVAGVAQFFS